MASRMDYREHQAQLDLTERQWLDILEKEGISGVMKKKKEIEEQWRRQPVIIAVIGSCGSGKSTLIRRLLNIPPGSPEGPTAGVSVIECTKEAKEYHQRNTGLIYCDLPGVGSTTENFQFHTPTQQNAYCERFRLCTVDYFILVSHNKFTKECELLANYVQNTLSKKIIFVQSKVDTFRLETEHQIYEMEHDFDALKEKIRTDIKASLNTVSADNIFLISNGLQIEIRGGKKCMIYQSSNEYEFDKMVEKIINDISGKNTAKANAFILATGNISETVIKARGNALRRSGYGWAMLSGIIGAVPVPGVSMTFDASLAIGVMANCFKAFGLNSATYMGTGSPREMIQEFVCTVAKKMGKQAAIQLSIAIAANAAEEAIKFVPGVGTVVGSVLGVFTSAAAMKALINYTVDLCEAEALLLLKHS